MLAGRRFSNANSRSELIQSEQVSQACSRWVKYGGINISHELIMLLPMQPTVTVITFIQVHITGHVQLVRTLQSFLQRLYCRKIMSSLYPAGPQPVLFCDVWRKPGEKKKLQQWTFQYLFSFLYHLQFEKLKWVHLWPLSQQLIFLDVLFFQFHYKNSNPIHHLFFLKKILLVLENKYIQERKREFYL